MLAEGRCPTGGGGVVPALTASPEAGLRDTCCTDTRRWGRALPFLNFY